MNYTIIHAYIYIYNMYSYFHCARCLSNSTDGGNIPCKVRGAAPGMRIGYRSFCLFARQGSSWINESKFQNFSGSTWPCPIRPILSCATTMRRPCDDKGYILSGRNHGRCGLDRLRNCKALASRHPILFPDSLHFSWILLVILVYSSDLLPCFNTSTTVKHI